MVREILENVWIDMPLNLVNIDDANIRELMQSEFEQDVTERKIYLSPRLKEDYHQTYLELMREAIQSGYADSFATQIRAQNCLKLTEQRRKPSGGWTTVKVPRTAHITMAEGEFNRFYLRALCQKAIEEDAKIEVYRAKPVSRPRAESEALIGKKLDPHLLLRDLRTNIGVDLALGLPAGPNSGLSGRILPMRARGGK